MTAVVREKAQHRRSEGGGGKSVRRRSRINDEDVRSTLTNKKIKIREGTGKYRENWREGPSTTTTTRKTGREGTGDGVG